MRKQDGLPDHPAPTTSLLVYGPPWQNTRGDEVIYDMFPIVVVDAGTPRAALRQARVFVDQLYAFAPQLFEPAVTASVWDCPVLLKAGEANFSNAVKRARKYEALFARRYWQLLRQSVLYWRSFQPPPTSEQNCLVRYTPADDIETFEGAPGCRTPPEVSVSLEEVLDALPRLHRLQQHLADWQTPCPEGRVYDWRKDRSTSALLASRSQTTFAVYLKFCFMTSTE